MDGEREWVEEVTRFTLESRVNGTLEIDLGLSSDFCSHLLRRDPLDDAVPCTAQEDCSAGVPRYPLYKRLASALHRSITSGKLCVLREELLFRNDDVEPKEEWGRLLREDGLELFNILRTVSSEVDVQGTSFARLKDGLKTIEGICGDGDDCRIEPGDLLLINKTLALQVEDVPRYASFSEMLNAERVEKVLPGSFLLTILGANMYCAFYSEKDETSNGVFTISVMKSFAQPYLSLARILSGLSYEGIQFLLGLGRTVGTVSDALPPPRSILLSSFTQQHKPNIKGSALTSGARALAKHSGRSSSKFWGIPSGDDFQKNRFAMEVVGHLIASCCWLNLHIVPQHGVVFEIRIANGYGARWSKDGTQFIGFLEPHMEDGHLKGWKH